MDTSQIALITSSLFFCSQHLSDSCCLIFYSILRRDGDGEGKEKIWNDVDVIEVVVVEIVVTSRS